jgi:hypothetical protein
MRFIRRVFAGELWRKTMAEPARVKLCLEKYTGLANGLVGRCGLIHGSVSQK